MIILIQISHRFLPFFSGFTKIMEKYNMVILGLRGVITDGKIVKPDIVNTLINFKKQNIRWMNNQRKTAAFICSSLL